MPENKKRGERFSREKEEMKCERETVDDGKIVNDDYKMYDSAQSFTLKTIIMPSVWYTSVN